MDKPTRCCTPDSLVSLMVVVAGQYEMLATHPEVNYQAVVRFKQAIGKTGRSSRREVTFALLRDGLGTKL